MSESFSDIGQFTTAIVKIDKVTPVGNSWLLESSTEELSDRIGVQMEDSLLDPSRWKQAKVRLTNMSGFTQKLDADTILGTAQPVDMVEPVLENSEEESTMVRLVSGDAELRIGKLLELVEMPEELGEEDTVKFRECLVRHHQAFCLETCERGETDLVQMEIDTLDAAPKRQPVRQMPYSVRQEVAKQLQDTCTPQVDREDSFHHSTRTIPIQGYAIWADQCPLHFPAVNAQGIAGLESSRGTGFCLCLY